MSITAIELLELLVVGNLRAIALLAIVAGMLSLCRRRVPPPARRDAWRIALAGCVIMPVLGPMLPTVSVPALPSLAVPPTLDRLPFGDGVDLLSTREPSVRIVELFLLVYLAGVALVAARHAHSSIELWRHSRTTVPWVDPTALELLEELRRRFGIERKLELRRSRNAASAYSWGWPAAQIVLPVEAESWTGERLRDVLVHEVSHVAHRDWLWLHVTRLIGAVYWLNPVVALVIRQHALEMEKACDECVLTMGGDGADYAEHLVELMSAPRNAVRAGIALGAGHFRQRIRAILDFPGGCGTMNRVNAHVVISIAVASILVLSTFELTSAQPDAGRQSGEPDVAPPAALPQRERRRALEEETHRLINEFNELDQAVYEALRGALGTDSRDVEAGAEAQRRQAYSRAYTQARESTSEDRREFQRQLAARTELTNEERSLEQYNFELRAENEARRSALESLEAEGAQRAQ